MPLVETFGFSRNLHDRAMHRASQASSVQSWLSTYELEISKSFTVPLAVHTIPDSSIRAQKRISKVIARVTVASLWLLVLSNLAFAVLAVVIAVLALGVTNSDAHQIFLQLGVPGLVAALFEPDPERKIVGTECELFQENRGEALRTAVTIVKRAAGGMAWRSRPIDVPATPAKPTQQSIVPRHLDVSTGVAPLSLIGLGDIHKPLLENERG